MVWVFCFISQAYRKVQKCRSYGLSNWQKGMAQKLAVEKNIGVVDSGFNCWLPFLSCRLLSFGSFTSFTRLFIARPKGLALGYSFASLSHKGFPIPSFTIVQSVIGLYLLNVHSLFVRSLLLLHKQACSVLLHKQVYSVACLFLFLHYRSVIRLYKD